MFLMYGHDEGLIVRGYTNASFMTDSNDYKSQSGYVFTLNVGGVSRNSSKKNTVRDATMEAEYLAASKVSKEGCWINKFNTELGVVPTALDPVEIYSDNSGTVAGKRAKVPQQI